VTIWFVPVATDFTFRIYKNFTAAKIDGRQQRIEETIHRYLAALDTADRTQPVEIEVRTNRLSDKIERLRK